MRRRPLASYIHFKFPPSSVVGDGSTDGADTSKEWKERQNHGQQPSS
jgi:hypothetical protein